MTKNHVLILLILGRIVSQHWVQLSVGKRPNGFFCIILIPVQRTKSGVSVESQLAILTFLSFYFLFKAKKLIFPIGGICCVLKTLFALTKNVDSFYF